MKFRQLLAVVLGVSVAALGYSDSNPYKLRIQGSEEVLGPAKGAYSVDLLGSLTFPDEGDDTGLALANVGYFVDRNLEILGSILLGFSGGDSLTSYGAGVRYHFIGQSASRTVPYLFASFYSFEVSGGDRSSAFVYGGGVQFFLRPMQAFVAELSRVEPDEGDGATTLFFGFRAFISR